MVIGIEGGIGKGSGRSVTGVDLGAAIQRLAAEGLLLRGGGHRMAAGLTVEQGKIEAAMERLGDLLARQGRGTGGSGDLRVDGLLMPGAATLALVDQIEAAGPFGAAAPAPRFAFADQRVTARRVGEAHLRITLTDGQAHPLEGILFGAFDTPIGPALLTPGAQRFHLAGRLEVSHWNGRSKVQLRVEDVACA